MRVFTKNYENIYLVPLILSIFSLAVIAIALQLDTTLRNDLLLFFNS